MSARITIATPAADRNLLTIAQLRAAAGVKDDSQDALLTALGLAVSDLVSIQCNVAGDGINPPTLLAEDVVEVQHRFGRDGGLILARRFVQNVIITVDGTVLDDTTYEVDGSSGAIRNLDYVRHVRRQYQVHRQTVSIAYKAGFDDVPGPLQLAVQLAVHNNWASVNREVGLKTERVDGVGTKEYWSDIQTEVGMLSPMVLNIIAPYRNLAVA